MQKLYTLKDRLEDTLKEYSEKNQFSLSEIDAVKNLISAILKICEYCDMEEGNSYNSYGNSYDNSYGNSYGNSYARGRGRYAKRDSMGRYSSRYSRGDMMEHLEEMAHNEPDERKRREYMEMVDKMRNM